jgi:putative ABC transport system permease protein
MDIRPILSTLRRHKTASALIVLEIALTCAIICNALFLISDRLSQIHEVSGIAENQLVRVQITSIGEDADQVPRTRTDLAALRAIPGVRDATITNQVPFVNSSWNSGVRLSKDQQQSTMVATSYMADEHFLDTFGLKLVAGRNFEPGEYIEYEDFDKPGANIAIPGAIITEKMAQKLFPGQNAVGKSFYSWGDQPTRIVGVVEHLVRPSQFGGPEAREYSMIFPLRPHYNVGGNYVIRVADPARRQEVLQAAKKALLANGNDRIVLDDSSKTFEDLRHEFYQAPRAMAWLLGIVCLASFWVQQRTKQIGVRRALGATRGQILRYFQTENFLLATFGIVLGMIGAFGINQLLMGAYELPRLPALYLPVGALVLWLLGQASVLGPARRAAAVPPAVATRSV